MSTQIQRRRGTTAEHSTFTGVEGELTVDTTKDTAVVHDGTTVGGHPLQKQYPPLGSAAAPTYTFTGDPNTGIYSPGADQVAISTNGNGRLFVDASGNVSIKSTNAGTGSLTIDALSSNYTELKLSKNGTTYGNLQVAFNDVNLVQEQNANLRLYTNNTERLRITSAGLVGIGTSVPSKIVNARSASQYDGFLLSNASNSVVEVVGFSATNDNGAVLLRNAGTANVQLLASGTSYFNGGNVGIGTTSPQSRFVVSNNGAEGIEIRPEFSDIVSYNRSGATWGDLKLNAANNIFQIQSGEVGRFDNSGRLLVGTSSASQSFDGGTTIGAQIEHTGSSNKNLLRLVSNAAFNWPAVLSFARSRGTANGAVTAVASGDHLGNLSWAGADGTGHVLAAQISASVDGTPGANDMPGRLVFSTTSDGASSPTERLRIDSSGRLLVGTSSVAGVSYNSYYAKTVVAGNTYDNTSGRLLIRTNTAVASLSSGAVIGDLFFSEAGGGDFASIKVEADAAPGTNDFPGRLVFSTTADGASLPTERMRIDSSGNILGGGMTGLPAGSSVKGFNFESQTNNGRLNLHANSSAGTASGINFYHSGSQVGGITYSSTATAYITSSDYRLKENVDAVINGIARLQQLKPCRFNFIADPNKTVDGFIAHEVQAVVPEAINGEKDAVDDDGNPIYQGIDQSKLVPLLTAALQEAIGEIKSLKARVAALESA